MLYILIHFKITINDQLYIFKHLFKYEKYVGRYNNIIYINISIQII